MGVGGLGLQLTAQPAQALVGLAGLVVLDQRIGRATPLFQIR